MNSNSGVSMIFPDPTDLIKHDFDDDDYHDDVAYEQTHRNEIVNLIMAAFQTSDNEDDESFNTSGSSQQSSNEQPLLNSNPRNNIDEDCVQANNESNHRNHSHSIIQQNHNGHNNNDENYIHHTNASYKEQQTTEQEASVNTKNSNVPYQHIHHNHLQSHAINAIDPLHAQELYYRSGNLSDLQIQIDKLLILCESKDRTISQLQNLCLEYQDRYEKSSYDLEKKYQLIKVENEQLIEQNNGLNKTIQDSEIKIDQMEKIKIKLDKQVSDSELLIASLQKKIEESNISESIQRTNEEFELILNNTCEKYEQDMKSLKEDLKGIQVHLQEKTNEIDGLRIQLEMEYQNHEKIDEERIETINQLHKQLNDFDEKYKLLLNENSFDSFNQKEFKSKIIRTTEENEKLEDQCHQLQNDIRTTRDRIDEDPNLLNGEIYADDTYAINNVHKNRENKSTVQQAIVDENLNLKQRIDEYISNEKRMIELNEELQRKIQEYERKSRRTNSSSSSSSDETVIATSIHTETVQNLTNQIENLNRDYNQLLEKYEYEKTEFQTMIEQLREDVIELEKIKQLYIDLTNDRNPTEIALRTKFELELKTKLDEFHKILQKDYDEKLLNSKTNQEKLEQTNRNLEQKSKQLQQDIEKMKKNYEKQHVELNNEIDRLKSDENTKNRLKYIENEFEQLKQDYSNLNSEKKELSTTCSILENQNKTLTKSNEKFEHDNNNLKKTFNSERSQLLNEIKQLNELNEHQKQELLDIHRNTDNTQNTMKRTIETLQTRLKEYEKTISQYEDYRSRFESNLQKLVQQRDATKTECKSLKDILTNKEHEYLQLKLRFDECENHLHRNNERFMQYEVTINDLQRKIQDSTQIRAAIRKDFENEYREKLVTIQNEKRQCEERMQQIEEALSFADSHLQEEVDKIKKSLEIEYNRRFERINKQNQHEIRQLKTEIDKQRKTIATLNEVNNSIQNQEDVKKQFRSEIDRLNREKAELNEYQIKLIENHQKQMEKMKQELDDGYSSIINEFKQEQTNLQTRYDQLKQQLVYAQQTIDQLKSNLNVIKQNHIDESSKLRETPSSDKSMSNYEKRNQHNQLQNRLDNLVKLLEQSNDTLDQERAVHAKQKTEYQQTIASLQKKVTDFKRSNDENKHELHNENFANLKFAVPRPVSMTDYVKTDVTTRNVKNDYATTVEKLRELFTNEIVALLRLTCKMIYDVHHRATTAPYMENLDITIKKQLQNELIRSRNSMIKEIRREIFEKLNQALRSQSVPDTAIDAYVFELDRLLSHMSQDCLESSAVSVVSSRSSVLSCQAPLQRSQCQSPISDYSITNKSTKPFKKSVECLYLVPKTNMQTISALDSRAKYDDNRRPKSASNIFLENENSSLTLTLSPRLQKYQRSSQKYYHMKVCKSEDDLVLATQRTPESRPKSDYKNEDNDDTLILNETEKIYRQSPVRMSIEQLELQRSSLLNQFYSKATTPDLYPTSQTRTLLIEQQQSEDDDELTWPQQPTLVTPTSHTNGIKKFVRSGLKLFVPQSANQQQQQQQQHKRIAK